MKSFLFLLLLSISTVFGENYIYIDKQTLPIGFKPLESLELTTFKNRERANLKNAQSKEEFCALAKDLRAFQAIPAIQPSIAVKASDYEPIRKIMDELNLTCEKMSHKDIADIMGRSDLFSLQAGFESRLSFENFGQIGACWWHSRVQRILSYLAIIRPLKPGEVKMTPIEIEKALDNMILNKEVTELRGFESLAHFSVINEKILKRKIHDWKIRSTLGFKWIKALEGKYALPPDELKKIMDETYVSVEVQGKSQFQYLQNKGLGMHSWVVIGMDKLFDNSKKQVGYKLHVVDSNYPRETKTYEYRFGDKTIKYLSDDSSLQFNFIPYSGEDKEFKKMLTGIIKYCKPELLNTKKTTIDNLLPEEKFTAEAWKELMK